ncbi:MAG TPA: hypothetical protein VFN75_06520 [Pseudonocardiaceae bacterium]|nr:hypothetical protein [Pseudonocardiaceae bacterium]
MRSSAVKAGTQAINQFKSLLVTAPADLREQLRPLDTSVLIETCARLRPGTDLTDPAISVKTALRRLATRIHALNTEIAEADRELAPLVGAAAPRLLALMGCQPRGRRAAAGHRWGQPGPATQRGRLCAPVRGRHRCRPAAAEPTGTG